MAVMLESSSWLELKLKKALLEEGIQFEEQHRVYEKMTDLQPKYVIDFLVFSGNVKVAVECDGFSFHSSDKDIEYSEQRDLWLKRAGYRTILHFTSNQIKHEMKTVLLVIKHNLGLISAPKKELRFKKTRERKTYIRNIRNVDKDLHKVVLYYTYKQIDKKLWVVYKYQDATLKKFSEERAKVFNNVPDNQGSAVALWIALKDLKRNVELTVHCPSKMICACLNREREFVEKSKSLMEIEKLLKPHDYLFEYIDTTRSPEYYVTPSTERFILQELQDRCRHLRYGKESANVSEVDFEAWARNNEEN